MQVRGRTTAGFSLIEVVIAIAILAVGMLSIAALMAQTMSGANRSKYMSLASTLASEKLEDLSRWPASDPHVLVPGGGTAGSLTADVVQNVTVGTTVTPVNYFDDVVTAVAGGSFSETVSGVDPISGAPQYTTTTHAPDGTVSTTVTNSPPTQVTFKRRWVIEQDQPVAGVRRVTVLVTLQDPSVQPPVTFQMSMVRP
jgi:prepilin-type N-terminal cleavage/methylation domain-containing protein